jgi:hypothetical protein
MSGPTSTGTGPAVPAIGYQWSSQPKRPFANPEAAARKLVEIAAGIEPVQDGRIHIEKINAPFSVSSKPVVRSSEPGSSMQLKEVG